MDCEVWQFRWIVIREQPIAAHANPTKGRKSVIHLVQSTAAILEVIVAIVVALVSFFG